MVIGLWEQSDGLEFIDFSVETIGEHSGLARTEQGFWTTQFDLLYEDEAPLEELRYAAAAVGFAFLDRYLAAREATESRLGTFEGHGAWLRELVASIDSDSGVLG